MIRAIILSSAESVCELCCRVSKGSAHAAEFVERSNSDDGGVCDSCKLIGYPAGHRVVTSGEVRGKRRQHIRNLRGMNQLTTLLRVL